VGSGGSCGGSSRFELGVRAFARTAHAGVCGVDFTLVVREPLTCGFGGVAASASLRDREPGAAIGVVGYNAYASVVQSVEDAVFAGGAHVVAGAGQCWRGPDQATGRVGDHLHVHPMAFGPGVVRPVPARGHTDPVDAQQCPVDDHECLPPGDGHRVAQRRCERGQGIEGFRGCSGTPWSCRSRTRRPGRRRSRPSADAPSRAGPAGQR
jgi:hypothetical protein